MRGMTTTLCMATLLFVAVAAAGVHAAAPLQAGNNCHGKANTLPIWTGTPALLKTVKNGELYTAGSSTDSVKVLHVYGNAYERGFAHGALLKEEIQELYPKFFKYIYGMVDSYIHMLPKDLREVVEKLGVAAALDLTADATHKFTPKHFLDEIKGVADGAGVEYSKVMQVQMLPELIQAACSIVGAWGPASVNGSLVQLRALDWGTDTPLSHYPMVTVFHPEAGDGEPFATLGWSGFVGGLTGYGSTVGVCEKVWLHYKGTKSRFGFPWHFLLRDVLQYSKSIDDAENMIHNADRTCSIFVGLGDRKLGQARIMEYSHEAANVYDDHNFPAYDNHPLKEGLVWVDKHTQPSGDTCLTDLLLGHYGELTPDVIAHQVVPAFQTGDLHAAVYSYGEHAIYVTVAQLDGEKVVPAYDRAWIRLDMGAAFAQKHSQQQ